jgi:hypothetical protein
MTLHKGGSFLPEHRAENQPAPTNFRRVRYHLSENQKFQLKRQAMCVRIT